MRPLISEPHASGFFWQASGEEKKEEGKKILIDSLKEICQFTKEQGPMEIYMKVFDYDIDKCFLIGHFKDAADVAAEVHKEFKNFGVLADLSTSPFSGKPRRRPSLL